MADLNYIATRLPSDGSRRRARSTASACAQAFVAVAIFSAAADSDDAPMPLNVCPWRAPRVSPRASASISSGVTRRSASCGRPRVASRAQKKAVREAAQSQLHDLLVEVADHERLRDGQLTSMSEARAHLHTFNNLLRRHRMKRTAEIDDGGRGGDVIYIDDHGPLRFCWEWEASALEIGVPTAEQWEEQTGRPLAGRLDMLRFIAERVIAKRGKRGSTFEVVEQPSAWLRIYV